MSYYYSELLRILRPYGIGQISLLRQPPDPGDIAYVGRIGESAIPQPPRSGLYVIYRDNGDHTLIHQEIVDAICRKFGIKKIKF